MRDLEKAPETIKLITDVMMRQMPPDSGISYRDAYLQILELVETRHWQDGEFIQIIEEDDLTPGQRAQADAARMLHSVFKGRA